MSVRSASTSGTFSTMGLVMSARFSLTLAGLSFGASTSKSRTSAPDGGRACAPPHRTSLSRMALAPYAQLIPDLFERILQTAPRLGGIYSPFVDVLREPLPGIFACDFGDLPTVAV